MTTTVDLRAVACGTEVQIVQDGVPKVIPPEVCYLGWQQSLQLLALLVEAEIPSTPCICNATCIGTGLTQHAAQQFGKPGKRAWLDVSMACYQYG